MGDLVDDNQVEDPGDLAESEFGELLERLHVALAGLYEVESKLGVGGMAYVFLAHDIKHDRRVAIKVLKPDLASSLGAERFLREITNAAKLSHPHILPLYDSGDADGMLYYVMPLVEGESLAEYIEREKQLSIEEAVKIAREVAEALSLAHSYGLVHRDIKPENVMITGGHAVVADFGIATAIGQGGGEKLTQTGMTMGTPAYMSPEQAGGDPNIDGRSDIYSLGCMLYEMLIGQIPFTAPTPQAMIARHTMDHITPPHIMRDSIPPDLENIVFTAMEKTPADRFRTAQEFAEALQAVEQGTAPKVRLSTTSYRPTTGMYGQPAANRTRNILLGAAAAVVLVAGGVAVWQLVDSRDQASLGDIGGLPPSSVAVLYFEDLSRDGSLGHVADGFTEGLIEKLAQVRSLDVISRNGVAQFRDATTPRDSIAEALGVGSLVEGSIQPVGDELRVNTRLLDGSGSEFARDNFALPAGDLLGAQDSLAEQVSDFLRRRLGEEVRLREQRARTANPDAWMLVQRGERIRKQAREMELEDDVAAIAMYETADSIFALAEQVDPRWAEPTVQRGEVSRRRAILADDPAEADGWAEAGMSQAERALVIDDGNAKALAVRGASLYYAWWFGPEPEPDESQRMLTEAKLSLEAAVSQDHTLADAYNNLSNVLYELGDKVGANLQAINAYEADAYLRNADRVLDGLYSTSYDLENFSEAKRWCAEGHRRFPHDANFVMCHLWLFSTRIVEPDPDSAWTLLDELVRLTPEYDVEYMRREGQIFVGAALARAGMADSARAVLIAARGNDEIDPDRSLVPKEAFVRVLLADTTEAIELLRSYMVFNPHHRDEESEDVHWWWRPLQDDPRYQTLMRR
jgi:serine/threonine-protein kinase